MAVALEVGWGSDEIGIARLSKKRAWGDDHQKLLEMMMGRPFDELANAGAAGKHTLDLLGSSSSSSSAQAAAAAAASVSVEVQDEQSDFLELGQDVPLPSGWEKRLDLKSGTVFFINLNTGKSTYNDPRQAQPCHFSLELLQSELGKQQMLNSTRNSSSRNPQSHLDCEILNRSKKVKEKSWSDIETESGNPRKSNGTVLDLKLNLSSSKPDSDSPPLWLLGSSVMSHRRTSDCPPADSMSPSGNRVSLTCCKRCLMYVMISQSDPRCPKCASSVLVDFPMPKKPRFNLEL